MRKRKEKFTPGPWHVVSVEYGYRIEPAIAWMGDKAHVPDEVNRANAAIISAAPEMYEFVHMFVSMAGQAILKNADNGKEIYNEAVRLINKARGEE